VHTAKRKKERKKEICNRESSIMSDPEKSSAEGHDDGSSRLVISSDPVVGTTIESLRDADEALAFFRNHPRASEIAEEGAAILEDPVQLRRLVRKIDLSIAPLLAAVYVSSFLIFLFSFENHLL